MGDVIGHILNFSIAEISIGDILLIILCVVGGLLLDKAGQWFFKRLQSLCDSEHRFAKVREIFLTNLRKPFHLLCMTLGCGLGLTLIETPSWGETVFKYIFIAMRALLIWCVVWYLLCVVNEGTKYLSQKAGETDSKLDDMLVPVASGLVKFLLIAVGILLVLQNLGFSVSSLVAGLGIGSAAIALAAKDTLANLFGSLVVFLDHPFEIGDWISLNGVEGEVEEIRLRSTVIRTFENSVILMPNQLLTTTYIDNYERRKCRKMDCSFGVVYTTTKEQLQTIVEGIQTHLKSHPELYSPSHYVAFNGFGVSSLEITVIAFTLNTGKAAHMADRQAFMFKIMEIVEAAGTSFAQPTRTLNFATGTEDMPMHFVMSKK